MDAIPNNLLRPGSLVQDHFQRDGFAAPSTTALFSEKIAFLAQYRDFHAFFAQGARLEAAKLLVGMLMAGLPPKRFYAVLLLDAVPLLEDATVHFDSQETFELLRCLQEIDSAAHRAEYLRPIGLLALGGKKGKANPEQVLQAANQQVKIIRLALARNLSRCFTVAAISE